jgi:hypothetical protein
MDDGVRGKERRSQCFPQACGRPDSWSQREWRGPGERAASAVFSQGRMRKVAWTFGHVLSSGGSALVSPEKGSPLLLAITMSRDRWTIQKLLLYRKKALNGTLIFVIK